ncbi:hypothetical protein BDQ12DRAFT_750941 [Crucibulum laeve]|uniref:Yeast cell wall synthesis Kre9/Knh1-like N-terminal domain-containing protein n=1 Tax=Crucibulum laeve TaxID=68775 RepID=A0A5C3M8F7_9AGAR|nr:hypothetical protein BDQ12DRAFT_750941 [Crucibulum laeve]
MNMKGLFTLLVATMATTVSAAPADNVNVARTFAPTILTPNSATVWPVNTVQTVTWDPAGATDSNSLLLLTKGGTLNGNHRLAENFTISAGSVDITVPDVVPDSDYQLAFFGDSTGVVSQVFTISA